MFAVGGHRLDAQYTVRSWLPWRTIETRHFAFHYPVELEAWTREVASRADGIDSAVAAIVGFAPSGKTHVIVDDPYEVANGSAWPYVDRPLINLWATPPEPRDDIGEFRVWGEMLISHEFTHIAHLTRPSRNSRMRRLWQALPANLGPITINAPRWAIEGYATYVEGKVTGSGRPRGVWRAAFLRQWALEGQLPRYENLNSWGAYGGGEFAYLAGSAFLEWLTERPGASDSSLVFLWRRMTAKQTRSFDEAFIGVFGESPRTLYGLFSAELTGDALEVARRIRVAGAADTGTVVQRLAWNTGDPAISADGQRAVIVLRSPVRQSRVVIWRTAAEPDTGKARRDSLLRKSDPLDVPARPLYPPPKRVMAVLRSNGASYEDPRFLADGRVLLWKNTPQGDGSQRPDLYLWDPRRGAVRRITHGASIRDADPAADGHTAYAVRCHGGACDLVSVSLIDGGVTTILVGSPMTSYYRPRVRPGSSELVVSVHTSERWRLAIVDTRAAAARYLTPGDSVNRYDASWLSQTEIVAVSEAGGVPNLELLDVSTERATPITRVTGAAVAPEPNRRNRSIWFLSLYSRGYDLRDVTASAVAPATIPTLSRSLEPAARVAPVDTTPFPTNAVSSPRPFTVSPRLFRWIPTPQIDADGANLGLGLASTDVIGRSELLGKVAFGDRATWRGAALDLTWRGMRPFIRAELFDAAQSPSASRSAVPAVPAGASALISAALFDARLAGGLASIEGSHQGEAWAARYRGGASAARESQASAFARTSLFGDVNLAAAQRKDRVVESETFAANVSTGRSFDRQFTRAVASVGFNSSGLTPLPFSLAATYARTNADAPIYEQITLGGSPSSLLDRSLLMQRLAMPVLPTGIRVGPQAVTYRATVRSQPLDLFFWGGSTAATTTRFSEWNRVVGLDGTMSIAAIPLAGTPAARAQYGVGYSLDEPFRKKVRLYLGLVLNP